MNIEEIVMLLRAAVSEFNAGDSGDALAGSVTELADELAGYAAQNPEG